MKHENTGRLPVFFVFISINFKKMEETKAKCPHCERREKEEAEQEEINFAVLLTLVPLLAMTLFSQVGLL